MESLDKFSSRQKYTSGIFDHTRPAVILENRPDPWMSLKQADLLLNVLTL